MTSFIIKPFSKDATCIGDCQSSLKRKVFKFEFALLQKLAHHSYDLKTNAAIRTCMTWHDEKANVFPDLETFVGVAMNRAICIA